MKNLQKNICAAILFFASSCGIAAEDLRTLNEDNYRRRGIKEFDDAVLRYLRKESDKIFNGSPAAVGAYPWQVSLSNKWMTDKDVVAAHFCGGFIVAQRWVVTAAHCVTGPKNDYIIRAGSQTLAKDTPKYEIERVISHKSYTSDDAGRQEYDIALLKLKNPIPMSSNAAIIRPATELDESVLPAASLSIAGWGRTSSTSPRVRELLSAKVNFVDHNTCNMPFAFDNRVSDVMICAGNSNSDSCQGDSGGALSFPSASPIAFGIVSWGKPCEDGAYGVYTRVSKFSNWIALCLRGDGNCNR